MSILAAMMGVMSEAGGQDNTPDAIDWANISGTFFADTTAETVTGIYDTIDIWWDYDTGTGFGTPASVLVNINNTTFQTISAGSVNAVTVSNNQTVQWRATSGQAGWTRTIRIYNASDDNAEIDSFLVTLAGA